MRVLLRYKALRRRLVAVAAALTITAVAVVSMSTPASAIAARVGRITGLAGKCMTVPDGSPGNGTPVQMSGCLSGGRRGQTWYVGADGTIRATEKCLTIHAGGMTNGTPVELSDCNGHWSQQWVQHSTNKTLINTTSGLCLDVKGSATADGTLLQVWSCTNAANQVWTLPTSKGELPDLPTMAPPTLDSVQVAGTSATLHWTDQSTNEDSFIVLRRNATGGLLTSVGEVFSTSVAGTGKAYTFVDTIPAGTRQCYEIDNYNFAGTGSNSSRDVCTSPLSLPPVPATTLGALSNIDALGDYNSVAVGTDGKAIMAYLKDSTNDLRVAHCNDVACSAVTTRDLDTSGLVGDYPSIKIGSDGLPLIAYEYFANASGQGTFDLRVAHCTDVTCGSATITTLDTASRVGQLSLAIASDGLGVIAYEDFSESFNDPNGFTNIKYQHCSNAACTSATQRTVEQTLGYSSVPNGGQTRIGIASSVTGAVYVTYWHGSASDLEIAMCIDAACTSGFGKQTIDYTGKVGVSPSVAVGRDGMALIAYEDVATFPSKLVVAHCLNMYCTVSTKTQIDSSASFPSLAIGADGFGVISYTDRSNMDIVVAHCTNLDCSSSTTHRVDEFGSLGNLGASVAVGSDGLPLVVYGDNSMPGFKAVHCGDVACLTDVVTPF